MKYIPSKIEKKWQKRWVKSKFYQAKDFSKKPKKYLMVEFPYPSGDGLHVGHIRSYTALDVLARKKRMEGFNVLYPMGWDAFGLPTENYALKTGLHPAKITGQNIINFKRQMKSLGLSFDWSREINTTDPNYYKWTQWIFLQFFKRGLAYQAEMPINWCPKCKIGLANEEVVAGKCERCGAETKMRMKKQWLLRITKYADRLIDDLKKVDYVEKIKTQQINWIGRSEGTEINFKSPDLPHFDAGGRDSHISHIKVFTTRADTLFGVTALVLALEHPLVKKITTPEHKKEVEKYIEISKKKSEFERTQLEKEKTGVFIGAYCLNPANNERVPIWVGDYVVATYGGGAVMVVPAHDKRDFQFAKKYDLPIKQVVIPDRKKLCLLIHGSPRYDKQKDKDYIPDNERHWFSWLKKKLEENNIRVSNPLMLEPWQPDYNKWKQEIEKLKINEDSVLVGHSAGGTFLVRWLGEEQIKIDKLILIAPGKILTKDNIRLKNLYDFEINQNIKNLANKIYILFSEDDAEYRAKNNLIYQKELDAKLILFKNKGHFVLGSMGTEEFPELLELILDKEAYIDYGTLVNSGQFSGLSSQEAMEKITDWLIRKKLGQRTIQYKLRDWIFSRQHYWGEPIPLVHCEKCGVVPVPEKDLPIKLPYVKKYEPTETGESPLAKIEKWVKTKCPKCQGPAKRETDTMPNWAGSSWYFLRYLDPKNKKALADFKKLKYWLPVDLYDGGMEHTTLHLLYSRFWHKFLYDLGIVPTNEPYQRRYSHGVVLAQDSRKMSKSFGNVINPDEIVKSFGADALRVYEMFMGPFDQMISWNSQGLKGCFRFLKRVWGLKTANSEQRTANSDKNLERLIHQTIKKVSEDLDNLKFNTAVSALMILTNTLAELKEIPNRYYKILLILLSPFAPHLSEELWEKLGYKKSIFLECWPKYDLKLIEKEIISLVIQVNGRVRDRIELSKSLFEKEIKELALSRPKIQKWLAGQKPKKIIYISEKLINFVV